MWESVIKLIVVFPIIIGLLLMTLRLLQKRTILNQPNKPLTVIDQIRLNAKSSIFVIKAGQQHLVVGLSDDKFDVLTTLTKEEMSEFEVTNQLVQKGNAENETTIEKLFKVIKST